MFGRGSGKQCKVVILFVIFLWAVVFLREDSVIDKQLEICTKFNPDKRTVG